jgi:uncharacterized surface protein with fasciclin (FAS1) repeats
VNKATAFTDLHTLLLLGDATQKLLSKDSRKYQMHDIIDTAVAAGTFKTLAAAVTAAGLVDTLKGAGPFTVFAPSDDAFAKLPAGTVESLLKDIPKLTAILTYHVVAGKVMATDVMTMDGKTAATVNGALLKISTTNGVKLNGEVNVVATDIACTNGVIHVIDAVLLPSA